MQCDDSRLSAVDELMAGTPVETTINKKLSEQRGHLGKLTRRMRELGSGISGTFGGMAGKFLLALVTGVGVWVANQLIQKWLTSSKVKGRHSKIIEASYEPIIRDVLRALQPALTLAVRQVSQGQVVDANRIVAKERAKITRIIDGHFMEMVKKLRVDIHQSILEDVSLKLDEALTTHVPQALAGQDQFSGTQTPTINF